MTGPAAAGLARTGIRIAVVVGNPKPASRTLGVAMAVAAAIRREWPGKGERPSADEPLVIELAEHAASLFDPGAQPIGALTAQVAACDLVIAASPTYKASYTGMLKAFFDRYGSNGLAGVVAVPVMTGAGAGHALAVEVHMRPTLVELGAVVPARGCYVTEAEFHDLPGAISRWAVTAAPVIQRAVGAGRSRPAAPVAVG